MMDVTLYGYARNVWLTYKLSKNSFRKFQFLQGCRDVTESNWCKQFKMTGKCHENQFEESEKCQLFRVCMFYEIRIFLN